MVCNNVVVAVMMLALYLLLLLLLQLLLSLLLLPLLGDAAVDPIVIATIASLLHLVYVIIDAELCVFVVVDAASAGDAITVVNQMYRRCCCTYIFIFLMTLLL